LKILLGELSFVDVDVGADADVGLGVLSKGTQPLSFVRSSYPRILSSKANPNPQFLAPALPIRRQSRPLI
jgi:hypothetical protein